MRVARTNPDGVRQGLDRQAPDVGRPSRILRVATRKPPPTLGLQPAPKDIGLSGRRVVGRRPRTTR